MDVSLTITTSSVHLFPFTVLTLVILCPLRDALTQSKPSQPTAVDFSFVQSTSSHWSNGDHNFVAAKGGLRIGEELQLDPFALRLSARFDLGARYMSDSASEALRVSDNEGSMELVLRYNAGWKLDPFVSIGLLTPLTESFRFTSTRVRTASMWDPVISTQTAGFQVSSLSRDTWLQARFGLSLKQTRAREHTQLTDDPRTRETREAYKPESGIESVIETTYLLDSSITIQGRLEVFGSLRETDRWILNSRNEIRARVWKFVSVTLTFDVLNNYRLSPYTQLRQSIALGVAQEL